MSASPVYNIASNTWGLVTAGGTALSKGFGAFGLSVAISNKKINLKLQPTYGSGLEKKVFELQMNVSGLEISVEKGVDLLEEFAGISVAKVQNSFEVTVPMINQKNRAPLKIADFMGPCSIISFDIGKAHIGKELMKHKGKTYLFIGQGSTIVDKNADWLQKVVDNTKNKSTLGGNVITFNKNSGPFSTARACTQLEVNENSLSAKATGVSIAMLSGHIYPKL